MVELTGQWLCRMEKSSCRSFSISSGAKGMPAR